MNDATNDAQSMVMTHFANESLLILWNRRLKGRNYLGIRYGLVTKAEWKALAEAWRVCWLQTAPRFQLRRKPHATGCKESCCCP